MQRPILTLTITLTLTLHLLLNYQLVTRDELSYWRVEQTWTSAGCPCRSFRLAFWSAATRGVQMHPRQRKMRHSNSSGDKNKEMGWGIYLFVLRENKRIKPSKCSTMYLQTSLIPKFSRVDTPGPSLKRRRGRSRREDGERRGGRLRHGCRGDGRPWQQPLWSSHKVTSYFSVFFLRALCRCDMSATAASEQPIVVY